MATGKKIRCADRRELTAIKRGLPSGITPEGRPLLSFSSDGSPAFSSFPFPHPFRTYVPENTRQKSDILVKRRSYRALTGKHFLEHSLDLIGKTKLD